MKKKIPEPAWRGVIKRLHFPIEIILLCVRWYVAYPLSLRHLQEMMEEHGVSVVHTTIGRWLRKLLPLFEKQFRQYKKPVLDSWRMDETYVKISGCWYYLYRAVDKAGATIDFLLTAKRDKKAALRFFSKAIKQHGIPRAVVIDKSGSNIAALADSNDQLETKIEVRQIKYLNNLVEQNHRAIKRIIRPMLGFKSFYSAQVTLGGIEIMHMLKKGKMQNPDNTARTPAQQFYMLAA